MTTSTAAITVPAGSDVVAWTAIALAVALTALAVVLVARIVQLQRQQKAAEAPVFVEPAPHRRTWVAVPAAIEITLEGVTR